MKPGFELDELERRETRNHILLAIALIALAAAIVMTGLDL